MPRLKVIKNQETGEYQIVDNLTHESLNNYDLAFTKGYTFAGDGKTKEEVIQMQTQEDPEYDRGLLDGWAQYQVDNAEVDEAELRDSLRQAVYNYSLDKSESNFQAVLDAYHKLKDDDTDSHLTVTEEGEDYKFAYKFTKEELQKAKKFLEDNPNLKISSYDEESGDVTIEETQDETKNETVVEDSKVKKLSDTKLGIFKNNKCVKTLHKYGDSYIVMDAATDIKLHKELVENLTKALPFVKEMAVIMFDAGDYTFEAMPWKEKEEDPLQLKVRWSDPVHGGETGYAYTLSPIDEPIENVVAAIEQVING